MQPAARALAQAASPFPEVPLPVPAQRSYTWMAVSFVSGAALIGASFGLADAGDRRYADYLRATDPGRITDLYDDAVLFDRFSTASLVAGEVLIATGIYLAFLRRPLPSRLDMVLEPSRCGVSLRF
jgi:hypothetical protein